MLNHTLIRVRWRKLPLLKDCATLDEQYCCIITPCCKGKWRRDSASCAHYLDYLMLCGHKARLNMRRHIFAKTQNGTCVHVNRFLIIEHASLPWPRGLSIRDADD